MSQISLSEYCNNNFYSLNSMSGRVEKLDINFFQKSALKIINKNYSVTSILKQRQKGITSALALYITYLIASNSRYKNIIIVSCNDISRASFIQKIKHILEGSELFNNKYIVHTERNKISYFDYKVKVVSQSKDCLRGYNPDILIVDDAAQLMKLEDILMYTSVVNARGGKAIYSSTPIGTSMSVFKKFHLRLTDEMCIYRKKIIIEKLSKKYRDYTNSEVGTFNICYEKKALQAL